MSDDKTDELRVASGDRELDYAVNDLFCGKGETYPPYLRRLIDEWKVLEVRYCSLAKFIDGSEVFVGMDTERQDLMRRKMQVMKEYIDILDKQILLEISGKTNKPQ